MYDLAGGGGQVSGKDNFLSFDRIGHRAVCLPVVDDAVQEMGCLFREGVVLHITAVRGEHRQFHVIPLLRDLAGRPQLFIPEGALGAAQVKIEHIGTDEVIAAAHLTNRTVLEFQDNGANIFFELNHH